MKLLLTLVVAAVLAIGGLVALAHHDTVARLDTSYRKYEPVSASFSRFRGDKKHLVSVYWRLHFAKKPPVHDVFAFWSLRPFRHVTIVTK
jgi:outer membrane lipoprotein-sorting protein